MNKTVQFVKDTLVGGVLFLLPVALVLWLAEKVLPLARQLMHPVERLIPGHLVAQFALGTLLAALAILLVAFLAGLLARTSPGQRFIAWIEDSILGSLPNSPKVRTGYMTLVPERSLRPLDLPLAQTTLLLTRLGGGAAQALRHVDLRRDRGG